MLKKAKERSRRFRKALEGSGRSRYLEELTLIHGKDCRLDYKMSMYEGLSSRVIYHCHGGEISWGRNLPY